MVQSNDEPSDVPQLPQAALLTLAPGIVYQRPLSYRGTGPGVIAFLPSVPAPADDAQRPLDPEPIQKWAEESFCVAGCTGIPADGVKQALLTAKQAGFDRCRALETKDRLGLIVYDPTVLDAVVNAARDVLDVPFCLISYGAKPKDDSVSYLAHVPAGTQVNGAVRGDQQASVLKRDIKVFEYSTKSPHFVLPQLHASGEYHHSSASVAHSRSLKFIKKYFDGPYFDLEKIWDEHTAYEFGERAVEKTMATMVQEPYVNHVPVLTGGLGRHRLTDFYRNHFIFANPDDTELELISRTEGLDRIIDEFIFKFTHDRQVNWILPGVPPTGKRIEVPFMSVVNIRGDRLYHEHIWWDNACCLRQIGVLPTHVPFQGKMLRLPIAGIEAAEKLREPELVASNVMFESKEYGVHESIVNGH